MAIEVPTAAALPGWAIVPRPYLERSECQLVGTACSALVQFRSGRKLVPLLRAVYHSRVQARGTWRTVGSRPY